KTAALILIAPILAHGLYDALLMTSMVNAVLGGICFIITVILVYRLHIFARKKVLAMIDTDSYFGGGVMSFEIPGTDKTSSDFDIKDEQQNNNEFQT
ncbi:MAG: hypothetical protein J6Q22_02150, partial [Prevotella sp.]|nr:hypothetical protein [Prevotella sp.]